MNTPLPCDCITGGELCLSHASNTRQVGVPAHGNVAVHLCHRHRNLGDPALLIMALAKIDTRTREGHPGQEMFRKNQLVFNRSIGTFARILGWAGSSVRIESTQGHQWGFDVDHFKAHWTFPITPKHTH